MKKAPKTEDVRKLRGSTSDEDKRAGVVHEGRKSRSSTEEVQSPKSKPGIQILGRKPGVARVKSGETRKGHFLMGGGGVKKEKVGSKVSHFFGFRCS